MTLNIHNSDKCKTVISWSVCNKSERWVVSVVKKSDPDLEAWVFPIAIIKLLCFIIGSDLYYCCASMTIDSLIRNDILLLINMYIQQIIFNGEAWTVNMHIHSIYVYLSFIIENKVFYVLSILLSKKTMITWLITSQIERMEIRCQFKENGTEAMGEKLEEKFVLNKQRITEIIFFLFLTI